MHVVLSWVSLRIVRRGRFMDFISPELPKELEEYLKRYDELFPRREARECFRHYVSGLISETKRKNIWQIMRKVVDGSYQRGHHFLCESTWDAEQVNLRRMELWQSDPATRMNEAGWYVQDDTGQERRKRGKEKPEGANRLRGGTDGVARQYIGNVGKVSEGVVWVNTHYVDAGKKTLLTTDMYWPKASMERLPEDERTPKRRRDKIEIAIDQMRWVSRDDVIPGPKPRRAIVDAWFGSSPRYLNFVNDDLGWKYVAASRSNRRVFFNVPGTRGRPERSVREVMTLFKAGDFVKVPVKLSDGSEKMKWAAEVPKSAGLKVKKLRHRPRMIIVLDDPNRMDPEETDILLCNDEEMSLSEVVQAYSMRNFAEVLYREEKDDLGLDESQVQYEDRLLRHWTLAMVTQSMIETFRLKGELNEHAETEPKTFGQTLRLVQDIFRVEFWLGWLSKEPNLKRFVQWLCSSRGIRVSFG